jgi:osmoprotectant transport system ATP-binding protein
MSVAGATEGAPQHADGGVAIRLDHVGKVFPGSEAAAVGDLSFEVQEGELVALVGPSGCGKTTTLKMINRIIEPTSGSIEVLGQEVRSLPVHELRRGIGYVIQQVGLFPHRTIAANIATVPKLLGWDKRRIRERTDELVDLVGLDPNLLRRYPAALSGGQQQRVGVARALAADPPILLMDEPYSAVDPIVRARLQDELVQLQRRLHKTIVFVTHDIDEAIKLGDRIAILNVGGVLEQMGPPAEVLKEPANPFVAEFLGDERGLKRLALITVDELPLVDGPVVDASAGSAEARTAMERHGTSWFGVTHGGRIFGSVDGTALAEGTPVGELPRERFTSWCTPDTPVRQALDTLVTSRTNMAVVLDDDERYLGMLDIDAISQGVLEGPTG